MLSLASEYKDVYGDYQEKDPTYKNKPSDEDWTKIEKICGFLEIFSEVTDIISGNELENPSFDAPLHCAAHLRRPHSSGVLSSSAGSPLGCEYPTSNLFLPELAIIKEMLDKKCDSDDLDLMNMALKMKLKFDKYWGDSNELLSVAAVLDPRNKLKVIDFYAKLFYPLEADAKKHVDSIKNQLHVIFKEYVEVFADASVRSGNQVDGNANSNDNGGGKGSKGMSSGRSKLDRFIRSSDPGENTKSELDIYLEEGVFICEETNVDHFDPLDWWRANNLKFKVLSRMACDILAIPITSVASESTFSAGGRVIDPFRGSLGADTIQMLMCGGDWLRHFYGINKKHKVLEQLQSEIPPKFDCDD